MARKFLKGGAYGLLTVFIIWLLCFGAIKGVGILAKAIRDAGRPSSDVVTTSDCSHNRKDGCGTSCNCSHRANATCGGGCCKCKQPTKHKKIARRTTERLSPFDPDFVPLDPPEEKKVAVAPQAPPAPVVQEKVVHTRIVRDPDVTTPAPPPAREYRDDPPPRRRRVVDDYYDDEPRYRVYRPYVPPPPMVWYSRQYCEPQYNPRPYCSPQYQPRVWGGGGRTWNSPTGGPQYGPTPGTSGGPQHGPTPGGGGPRGGPTGGSTGGGPQHGPTGRR